MPFLAKYKFYSIYFSIFSLLILSSAAENVYVKNYKTGYKSSLIYRVKSIFIHNENGEDKKNLFHFNSPGRFLVTYKKKFNRFLIPDSGSYEITYNKTDNRYQNPASHKNSATMDSIFNINDYLCGIEKYSYRKMFESVGDQVSEDIITYLWVTGIDLKFLNSYSFGGEYRRIDNKLYKERQKCFLIQVRHSFSDTVNFSTGYCFDSLDNSFLNNHETYFKGAFFRVQSRF